MRRVNSTQLLGSAAVRKVVIHSGRVSISPLGGADVSAQPGNDGRARRIRTVYRKAEL